MGAGCVQPKDCLTALGLLAVDRQTDPIFDWGFAGGGGAPDVALFHAVLVQHIAIGGDHPHDTIGGDFKGGGVRAVFLGLLRHQADVLHGACGRRIKRTGLFEIADRLVIDGGIRAVGNDAIGVSGFAIWPPALAAGANKCGHRGVNDHIRGHMQVADALVGIHHIHRRAVGDGGGNISLNRGVVGHGGHAVHHGAKARVGVNTRRSQRRAVLFKHGCQEHLDRMTKDDRVRHLHHRGLEVDREQHALGLGGCDLFGQERLQRLGRHKGAIHDSARGVFDAVFQHGDRAILGHMFDARRTGLCVIERDRGFIRAEIAARHGGDMGFAVRRPGAHRMGVGLGKVLHRRGGAAVRVAFAQDRVHGRALDRIIATAGFLFRIGSGVFGIVGQVIALRLQFLDGGNQLRGRGRDVGQFDDIGLWCGDQCAQFGQIVGLAQVLRQAVGKRGDDPTRQRDVARPDGNPGCRSKGADDRQKRSRSQLRSLVNLGDDDIRLGRVGHGQAFVQRASVRAE